MKVEIQSLHFDADQKLTDFIYKKAEKLNTFFDKILGVEVILSMEHNSAQVKEKTAVIKAAIPGSVLVARESAKIFEESFALAYENLERQLKKHKEKIKN